jgi:hypothetical protein
MFLYPQKKTSTIAMTIKNHNNVEPTPVMHEDNSFDANPPTQSDSAWKRALDCWFQPFLESFWPDIEAQIDWEIPIEDLGQEMQALTNASVVGKQIVDKLYRVSTKSHENLMIILHLEIQGDKEDNFPTRLFEYGYKIYDRHRLPILPLVVLSDDHHAWRPEAFEMKILGHTTIRYDFLCAKLLDWKGQEAQLLESTNPFENLIAIYLEARRTRHSPTARLKTKLALFKHLLEKSWDKEDILSFATFLDGVMRLPESLALQYHHEVIELEKEMNVNYLTNAEYFGHQEGLREGMQQGMQQGMQAGIYKEKHENAKRMLMMGLDEAMIKEVTGLSKKEIEALEQV